MLTQVPLLPAQNTCFLIRRRWIGNRYGGRTWRGGGRWDNPVYRGLVTSRVNCRRRSLRRVSRQFNWWDGRLIRSISVIHRIDRLAHCRECRGGIPLWMSLTQHVTAVTVAYKNKMDLAVGVAVGSSMVLCSWCINSSKLPFSSLPLSFFWVGWLINPWHYTLITLRPPFFLRPCWLLMYALGSICWCSSWYKMGGVTIWKEFY